MEEGKRALDTLSTEVSKEMVLKRVVQLILLTWFLVINVAVLVPSYQLLFGSDNAGDSSQSETVSPPEPPPAPSVIGLQDLQQVQQLEAYKQQLAAYTEQIKGYTQEVTGYTQQMAAHKAHHEANEKSGRKGVYEVVVKNSLITLLGGFATTLLGLVFVNLGAGIVDNMVRLKNNAAPERLKLL